MLCFGLEMTSFWVKHNHEFPSGEGKSIRKEELGIVENAEIQKGLLANYSTVQRLKNWSHALKPCIQFH